MNILIINDFGACGSGTEIRIKQLIEGLKKQESIKSIHLLEDESSKSIMEGITVHRCNTYNSGDITSSIIKKYSIDIVQVHNLARISTRTIVAAKKLRIPVIFFVHDYWVFCGRRTLYSRWNSACEKANFAKCISCIGPMSFLKTLRNRKHLNLCDEGISPSNFCIQLYEKHGILKGKWTKVIPWIDDIFCENKKIKKDNKRVLFVGPLSKQKGAHLAANAMILVLKHFPEAKLRYIGYGQEKENPDRKHIENIFRNATFESSVEFGGEKTFQELTSEYSNADVYVCCPEWPEVFGQTWAQALSCGTSVVATNVGSIPELCPAKTVEPTAKSVAEGIMQAFLSEKKYSKWSTIDNVIQKLMCVYKKFVKLT